MSHETPQEHHTPEQDVNIDKLLAELGLPSKPTVEEPVKPTVPPAELPRVATPIIPPEPPVPDVDPDPAQFARDALSATGKNEATRFQELKLENVEIPTAPAITEPPSPSIPNRARVYDTPAPAAPAPQLVDVVLPPTDEDTAVHAAVTDVEAIPTPPPSDIDPKDVLPANGEESKKPSLADKGYDTGVKMSQSTPTRIAGKIIGGFYGFFKSRSPQETREMLFKKPQKPKNDNS